MIIPIIIVTIILAVLIQILLKTKKSNPIALHPTEFRKFKLIEKENVSHNTRRFTFALQTEDTRLGLPIGTHATLRFTDANGKNHQRSYTPVTGDEILGKVSFVIKIYKAGEHPKFPDGGKMSQHLDSLQIGDVQEMKGPKGHLNYLGKGKFTVKEMRKPISERNVKKIGMIAGGTGITPMLQIISAVLRDPDDKTTLSLLFANQTEDDILVREELESLAKKHPDQFKLHYTLDNPPKNWKYSSGFINKDMIASHLPPPASDDSTFVIICGPPPMVKYACIPNLTELGFKEHHYTAM